MARQPVEVSAEVVEFQRLFGKSSEVPKRLRTALRKRMKAAAEQASSAGIRSIFTRFDDITLVGGPLQCCRDARVRPGAHSLRTIWMRGAGTGFPG